MVDGQWSSTEAKRRPWPWQRSLYGLLSPEVWISRTCSPLCWSVSTWTADPESPGVPDTQAGTGLLPHSCFAEGPARELSAPKPARSLTLSARRGILRRMSVIIIDMFTHPALCKDINLCGPSPSADLIGISELGPGKKKKDAGHHDNNQKCFRSSHPACGLVAAAVLPSHVGCPMGGSRRDHILSC